MIKRRWGVGLCAGVVVCLLIAFGLSGASRFPAASAGQEPLAQPLSGRILRLTLEGAEGSSEITASLADTPAAEEFAEHLPLTIEMHDYLERQKEVYLPFSISKENQTNTVTEYSVGDIVYWHPGPTLGIFYEHDSNCINAGIEVLARLDEDGVEAFQSYSDLVTVTLSVDALLE